MMISSRCSIRRFCVPTLLVITLALVAWKSDFCRSLDAQTVPTLAIDGSQQFQVIDGFGASANAASWNSGELKPGIDLLVDQLGATIWRVVIENGDWEATNDNADPAVFNWTYYNSVYASPRLEELWGTIAYLNTKGITDGVMVNVMGPVASWMGGSQIDAPSEDEWVEMITSLAYYGRITRGLQFSMLAPLNEPDWDGIEGPRVGAEQYVRLMRKLALKLDAVGLSSLRLVGPDTAKVNDGVSTYLPAMMGDSVVMAKVDHFSLHNYDGDSGGADASIRSSAYSSRNFWITEVTNISDMLAHLSQGPSALLVWDAYDSVYNHAILAGRGSVAPNDASNGPALLAYNAATGIYTPRKGFYEAAQLFKFVPRGSRRIGASTSNSSISVFAFQDRSGGRVTIVGRNTSTSARTLTGTLAGLPAISRLELYQTTASTNLQRGTDVTVTNGAFSVQVSGSGIFTLTATTVADTAAPVVALSQPVNGARLAGSVTIEAAASDNVSVSGVQFLLDGSALNAEDTVAPYTTLWNTSSATAGSHQLSARARDGAGNTATAGVVSVTIDNGDATPPTTAITAPAPGATVTGAVTVSAAAADNVGVAGVQFLLDGATLGSEDTVAPYAVSWATTAAANGLHTLSVRARDSVGNLATSAPVTVTVANAAGPAPAGLVAAYAFDEGSGTTTTDNSGRGHTGTISGAAWTTTGRTGKALTFDGVNDVVTVADAADLDLTTGLTLDAWIRPTTLTDFRTVVLKETVGELAYALYASDETAQPILSGRIGDTTSFASATASLALNAWTHLAGTYDGATLRLYANGIQVGAQSLAGALNTTSSPLRIGGNSVWNEFFAGTIDDLRVYNRALSLAEIQTDMNTPVPTGPTAPDTTAPTVSLTAPSNGATVVGTVAITATANDGVGVTGVQFLLDGASLGTEDTTSPYSTSWNTVTSANGTHLVSARARDAAGNQTTSLASTVTVNNPVADTTPPTVTSTSPVGGATAVGTAAVVTATFSEPMNAASITPTTMTLRNGTTTVSGSVSYSNGIATLTPSSALANSTAYIATVKGGTGGARDLAGNLLAADKTWTFATAAPSGRTCPCGIWTSSTAPGPVDSDRGAIEIGLKFQTDTSGFITGLRFYKYAQNTGTHVGSLWSSTGTLLKTVTFTNETASGWQQASFATPVAVAANTTYVASYHTNSGFYAATDFGFTTGIDNAPLHALSSTAAGGNGVYRYSTPSAFPNQSYQASNYWVDVIFNR